VKRHKGAALATDPVAAGLDMVIAIPDPVVLSPLLVIFIISSAPVPLMAQRGESRAAGGG
jgi:hypothetical protein